jgi:hypothetical protein
MRTASSASLQRIQTLQKGRTYWTGRALPKPDISSATDKKDAADCEYAEFVVLLFPYSPDQPFYGSLKTQGNDRFLRNRRALSQDRFLALPAGS